MLNVAIFLPLFTGLLVLALPSARTAWIRWTALAGAAATLAVTGVLWAGYDAGLGGLQWRTTLPWIPGLGASYDVAVDGVSLPLLVLTALLLTGVNVYTLRAADRPKGHAFLFLLMATGLIGLFSAQDLLLFYLFFEVGLVPMYFIIGIWGHEDRRYAALKFFLYTRGASLAMLLGFLFLYLSAEPRTFSLPELVAQQPLAGADTAGLAVLVALLVGFGVKLPTVPLHNWLPDAHVEAPTEGSVMLAGVQLKMGAYGLFRIMLPLVPDAARELAWLLLALGVASLIYGALAALGQSDFKRLVALTSVNHMGYVMLGAGVWAASTDPGLRALAASGAVYQMVSHGLLTGAMFFLVGLLQDQTRTRELPAMGGLLRRMPVYAFVLGVVSFGSLGLPGLSGFVAEFQVLGATVAYDPWIAAAAALSLLITTGLYLKVVTGLLLGEGPEGMPAVREPPRAALGVVAVLAAFSLLLGLVPWLVLGPMASAVAALGGAG